MNLYKKALCITGVGFLLGSTQLFASEKSASDVMIKAFKHTGSMDKYGFKAVIVENTTLEDGTPVTYRYDTTVKVDRPGKIRVDTKGEFLNRSNYINAGLYTIIEHGHGYYGQLTVPKDLDKALDSIFKNYDIKAPLSSLVYSDMKNRMKFKSSKYFGTANVDGVACDYVAFKNGKREVHAWITTGNEPLVKAYSIIDTTTQPHIRTNTTISWGKSSSVRDSDFIFKAPKGAAKISVLPAN